MPFEGKTYSLVAGSTDSNGYFQRVRTLADRLLEPGLDASQLLETVRRISRNKRRARQFASQPEHGSEETALLHLLRDELAPFTRNVSSHLRTLPILRRWDRTLGTSEEQYHLHMLEIELVNRLNAPRFRNANARFALLPHCLRDLSAPCRSAPRGNDHVCKGCTRSCAVNRVSKSLRRHGVSPYIWMTANLPSLLRRSKGDGRSVGVLGIACVPELVNGMRSCQRLGVPAVGVPLDANRCARWWGEFYPNSVNELELERLLGEETLLVARTQAKPRPGGAESRS